MFCSTWNEINALFLRAILCCINYISLEETSFFLRCRLLMYCSLISCSIRVGIIQCQTLNGWYIPSTEISIKHFGLKDRMNKNEKIRMKFNVTNIRNLNHDNSKYHYMYAIQGRLDTIGMPYSYRIFINIRVWTHMVSSYLKST